MPPKSLRCDSRSPWHCFEASPAENRSTDLKSSLRAFLVLGPDESSRLCRGRASEYLPSEELTRLQSRGTSWLHVGLGGKGRNDGALEAGAARRSLRLHKATGHEAAKHHACALPLAQHQG